MHYTIPKGVFDILPQEPHPEDQWRSSDRWKYLESIIHQTARDYDFKEIRTPVFERTELFIRGVGESSDIVSKEMYTFLDKAERSMSLRPEGTAPVMRAFVEKHLYNQQSLHKLYYIGPMFRYERPQAGRYRQHHQFGVEAIGIGKPEQDIEVIDMLCELYRRLGLADLSVAINSVGDSSSRTLYKEKLTQYLTPHFNELSADSQERFSKNILRILDSKDPTDRKILERAPSILDTINEECVEHFEKVKQLLNKIGIHYTVDPKLVRGLDYYSKTVFEIVWGNLGAQNSIGGGGRYDGLISSLGGPDLPAVGYATGLERVLQTMDKQKVDFPSPPHPILFIIPIGESPREFCFELLCTLRHERLAVDMDLSGKKLQHGLQQANALGAEFCLIVGEDEMSMRKAKIKNLTTRDTVEIPFSDLVSKIKILHSNSHV